MYYAAYNTDFAVVIGIKAVLNLSETVAFHSIFTFHEYLHHTAY